MLCSLKNPSSICEPLAKFPGSISTGDDGLASKNKEPKNAFIARSNLAVIVSLMPIKKRGKKEEERTKLKKEL